MSDGAVWRFYTEPTPRTYTDYPRGVVEAVYKGIVLREYYNRTIGDLSRMVAIRRIENAIRLIKSGGFMYPSDTTMQRDGEATGE